MHDGHPDGAVVGGAGDELGELQVNLGGLVHDDFGVALETGGTSRQSSLARFLPMFSSRVSTVTVRRAMRYAVSKRGARNIAQPLVNLKVRKPMMSNAA